MSEKDPLQPLFEDRSKRINALPEKARTALEGLPEEQREKELDKQLGSMWMSRHVYGDYSNREKIYDNFEEFSDKELGTRDPHEAVNIIAQKYGEMKGKRLKKNPPSAPQRTPGEKTPMHEIPWWATKTAHESSVRSTIQTGEGFYAQLSGLSEAGLRLQTRELDEANRIMEINSELNKLKGEDRKEQGGLATFRGQEERETPDGFVDRGTVAPMGRPEGEEEAEEQEAEFDPYRDQIEKLEAEKEEILQKWSSRETNDKFLKILSNTYGDVSKLWREAKDDYKYEDIPEDFRQTYIGKFADTAGYSGSLLYQAAVPYVGAGLVQSNLYAEMETEARESAKQRGEEFDRQKHLLPRIMTAGVMAAVERMVGVERLVQKSIQNYGKRNMSELTWREIARESSKTATASGAQEVADEALQNTAKEIFQTVTKEIPDLDMTLGSFMERRGEEALFSGPLGVLMGGGVDVTTRAAERSREKQKVRERPGGKDGMPFGFSELTGPIRKTKTDKEIREMAGGNQELGTNLLHAANGDRDAYQAYLENATEQIPEGELIAGRPDMTRESVFRKGEKTYMFNVERGAYEIDPNTDLNSQYIEEVRQAGDIVQAGQQEAEARRAGAPRGTYDRLVVMSMPSGLDDGRSQAPVGAVRAPVQREQEGEHVVLNPDNNELIDTAQTKDEANEIAHRWQEERIDNMLSESVGTLDHLLGTTARQGFPMRGRVETPRTFGERVRAGEISEERAIQRAASSTGADAQTLRESGEWRGMTPVGSSRHQTRSFDTLEWVLSPVIPQDGAVDNEFRAVRNAIFGPTPDQAQDRFIEWVNTVSRGTSPFAPVEEIFESYVKHLSVMDGAQPGELSPGMRAQLVEWRKHWEENTDRPDLDEKYGWHDEGMIEWGSSRFMDYVSSSFEMARMGDQQAREEIESMPQGFRRFLTAIKRFVKQLFDKADLMARMRRNGGLHIDQEALNRAVLGFGQFQPKSLPQLRRLGYEIPSRSRGKRTAQSATNEVQKASGHSVAGDIEQAHMGRKTREFFSDVTKGKSDKYKPDLTRYSPVMPMTVTVNDFQSLRYDYRGRFDEHIMTSIPSFDEIQAVVGQALVDVYGRGARMLDIGASEGSTIKAISQRSGGNITGIALDPNQDMRDTFHRKGDVEGVEYALAAFVGPEAYGETLWTEKSNTGEGEVEIKGFAPQEKFDIIHEAMVFQFIDSNRAEQLDAVKATMKDDGLAIFEEKFQQDEPVQTQNEEKKDQWKMQFYDADQLSAKEKDVLRRKVEEGEKSSVGMQNDQAHVNDMEQALGERFDYVVQFWDSGNFRGYAASNDRSVVENFIKNLQIKPHDFETRAMPRPVAGNVGQTYQVQRNVEDRGFYSQMEQVLAKKVQGKRASVQQIRGLLTPKQGIKEEEVRWSGIEDWLDNNVQNGKVDTSALMEFLRNGQMTYFNETHFKAAEPPTQEEVDEMILAAEELEPDFLESPSPHMVESRKIDLTDGEVFRLEPQIDGETIYSDLEIMDVGLQDGVAEVTATLTKDAGGSSDIEVLITPDPYGGKNRVEIQRWSHGLQFTSQERSAINKEIRDEFAVVDVTSEVRTEALDAKDRREWLIDGLIESFRKGDWGRSREILTHIEDLERDFDKTLFRDNFPYNLMPDENNDVRYEKYKLPGGENYREVVVHMKTRKNFADGVANELPDGYQMVQDEGGDWVVLRQHPDDDSGAFNLVARGSTYEQAMENALAYVKRRSRYESPESYESSHFRGIHDYLGHYRLTDRDNVDGESGVFIEEIQSDRHQEGRKRGYYEEMRPEQRADLVNELEEQMIPLEEEMERMVPGAPENLSRPAKALWRSKARDKVPGFREIYDEYRKLRRRVAALKGSPPKDAPFREWHIQAFKRVLHQAVAGGKNWVGWTVGETQVRRYNLREMLDEISLVQEGDHFRVWFKEVGNSVPRETKDVIKNEDDLEEVIGKELAERLLTQEGDELRERTISGEELEVGGKGIKKIYDQMLVQQVNKYIKKWGGKVEESEVMAGDASEPIHFVRINDKMREEVLKGQPTYQVNGPMTDAKIDQLYKEAVDNGNMEQAAELFRLWRSRQGLVADEAAFDGFDPDEVAVPDFYGDEVVGDMYAGLEDEPRGVFSNPEDSLPVIYDDDGNLVPLSERGSRSTPNVTNQVVSAVHYSRAAGLDYLDPAYHGKGIRGREKYRRENYGEIYVPRIYVGLPGYRKESGLGDELYVIDVDDELLYDVQKDPEDYYSQAVRDVRQRKTDYAPLDQDAMFSLFERNVKNAGYLGIKSPDQNMAAIFHRIPTNTKLTKEWWAAQQRGEETNQVTPSQQMQNEIERIRGIDISEEDGATFNLDMTPYEGSGVVVPIASHDVDRNFVTPTDVQAFLESNRSNIGGPQVKVGIYKFPDSDRMSIDLNLIVPEENTDAALRFARRAGHESLFNLGTFENIKTGETGENVKKFTPQQYRAIYDALMKGEDPQVFGEEGKQESPQQPHELVDRTIDGDMVAEFLPETSQTANTLTKSDVSGKVFFGTYADRMRVGEYRGLNPDSGISIPLQGGMDYPLHHEGAGWAVSNKESFSKFSRRANETDGALVFAYAEGNITGNLTFADAYFAELKYNISRKRISKTEALKRMNEVRRMRAVQAALEKSPSKPLFAKNWKTIEDAQSAFQRTSFNARRAFFQTSVKQQARGAVLTGQNLAAKKHAQAGMPDVIAMVKEMEDPRFADMENGGLMGAIRLDKGQNGNYYQAHDFGVDEHRSYKYVLGGEFMGYSPRDININDLDPRFRGADLVAVMRAAETDFTVPDWMMEEELGGTNQVEQAEKAERLQNEAQEREDLPFLQEEQQRQQQNLERLEFDLGEPSWLNRGARYLGMPMSSRLRNISTQLFAKVREYRLDTSRRKMQYLERTQVARELFRKLSQQDRVELGTLLSNGLDNTDAGEAIYKKVPGLKEAIAEVRGVLDEVRRYAGAAGFEVPVRQQYWPRYLMDRDGLLASMGMDAKGAIDDAIAKAKRKAAKKGNPLTEEDIQKIVRNMLSGTYMPASLPANFKGRQIETLSTEQFESYYATAWDAVDRYINSVVEKVEQRKFFGKAAVVETDEHSTRTNLDKSIDKMVSEMVQNGELTPWQQEEVVGVLHAMHKNEITPRALSVLRTLGYMSTMANPNVAIIQVEDVTSAVFLGRGVGNVKYLSGLFDRDEYSMIRDLGMEGFSRDYQDAKLSMGKTLEWGMKYSGVAFFGRGGANTQVNSGIRAYQQAARRGKFSDNQELKLSEYFAGDAARINQLKKDLAEGEKTRDTILLGWNILLDWQPLDQIELPEGYARHPSGRVFYMLKTFFLKRFDVMRREGVRKMHLGVANRDFAQFRDGFKNLSWLWFIWWLGGMSVDWFRDYIGGKEPEISDVAFANMFKIAGVNRFIFWEAKRTDIQTAAFKWAMFPMPWFDYPLRDISSATGVNVLNFADEDNEVFGDPDEDWSVGNADTWRAIPFFGSQWYWHFGGGEAQQEKEREQEIKKARREAGF